ncbi:MAG: DMT family transporter [Actinomycetota bacterium]
MSPDMTGGDEAIVPREGPELRSWVLLLVGVGAASLSAILIRYAAEVEPLALSFWRCAAGAAVLAPFARLRAQRAYGAPLRMPLIAGAFLAVHFATWITSLELTTVASSVLLVSTTPVFVALAAWLLFGERLTRSGWTGIALAVTGAALVGGGGLGGSSAFGDGLALIGGATAGGYVLAGRLARRDLGIVVYATVTYAFSAGLLVVACVAAGVPLWGWSARTWLVIVAIVAGPQLLGHTVINLVLRDIDATTVSVSIMAEPIIATALAYVLFEEVPSLLVLPGGAAILVGIYLTTTARRAVPEIVE